MMKDIYARVRAAASALTGGQHVRYAPSSANETSFR
jgi:hypothetical protein